MKFTHLFFLSSFILLCSPSVAFGMNVNSKSESESVQNQIYSADARAHEFRAQLDLERDALALHILCDGPMATKEFIKVKKILKPESFEYIINSENADGNTLLSLAAYARNHAMVKELLFENVNAQHVNKLKKTPLMIADEDHDFETARLIVDYHKDLFKARFE